MCVCVCDLWARDINAFFPSGEESQCSRKWKRGGSPDPMGLHKSDLLASLGMQNQNQLYWPGMCAYTRKLTLFFLFLFFIYISYLFMLCLLCWAVCVSISVYADTVVAVLNLLKRKISTTVEQTQINPRLNVHTCHCSAGCSHSRELWFHNPVKTTNDQITPKKRWPCFAPAR